MFALEATPFDAKVLSATIRAKLLLRGWSRHDLAKAAGLDVDYVTGTICGFHARGRARRRIEAAMREAFWSSAEDFQSRLPMIDFYGGDVEVMYLPELTALVQKHLPGAPLPVRARRMAEFKVREKLILLLKNHFEQQQRGVEPVPAEPRGPPREPGCCSH